MQQIIDNIYEGIKGVSDAFYFPSPPDGFDLKKKIEGWAVTSPYDVDILQIEVEQPANNQDIHLKMCIEGRRVSEPTNKLSKLNAISHSLQSYLDRISKEPIDFTLLYEKDRDRFFVGLSGKKCVQLHESKHELNKEKIRAEYHSLADKYIYSINKNLHNATLSLITPREKERFKKYWNDLSSEEKQVKINQGLFADELENVKDFEVLFPSHKMKK